MGSPAYPINKGISRPVEFKGLKAQYIWYFAAGIIGVLVVYAVLYICNAPTVVSIATVLLLGSVMTVRIYAMSNTYGEHGFTKKIAARRLPRVLKVYDRNLYTRLASGKRGAAKPTFSDANG